MPATRRKETVVFAIALTLMWLVLSVSAFSQALSESVMLGASSSSAAGKAGSALGSALNRSSGQLAGRIQQQVPPSPQTNISQSGRQLILKNQSGGTMAQTSAQSGALTLSIEGAQPVCTNEKASSKQEKSRTNCTTPHAPASTESNRYKSVITLSLSK